MCNVQVVAEAMNCTANIAKGLRKDYKGPAMSLCPGVFHMSREPPGCWPLQLPPAAMLWRATSLWGADSCASVLQT